MARHNRIHDGAECENVVGRCRRANPVPSGRLEPRPGGNRRGRPGHRAAGKVGDAQVQRRVEQKVARRHVAVHHVDGVQRGHGRGRLPRPPLPDLRARAGLVLQQQEQAQAAPLQVFHREAEALRVPGDELGDVRAVAEALVDGGLGVHVAPVVRLPLWVVRVRLGRLGDVARRE